MKNESNRRKFIKHLSIGSLAATITPAALLKAEETEDLTKQTSEHFKPGLSKHTYNNTYTGDYLSRIAFPIGGLGAGMFCLEGAGAISHMSIRNKPDVFNEPGLFGAVSVKGL